jgi:DNA-binding IclR family transcriptional regulator
MSILKKAVQALQIIGLQGCVTPKELARAMKLSKSTAYRLMLSLTELRLVERLGAGEGFVLGPLLGELSGVSIVNEQLYRLARPHMIALRDRCGETVGLHTIHDSQRLLLGQEVSSHQHRWVFTNVKVPMPLHAGAASKMLLASLSLQEADVLLSNKDLQILTANTPRNRVRLLKELEQIKKQGFAITHEEIVPGVASLAIRIDLDSPDRSSPVVLSITGPSQRLPDTVLKALLPQIRESANRIAAETAVKSKPLLVAG